MSTLLSDDPLAYAEQRVRELLAEGTSAEQLTVEQVFGRSREQLLAAVPVAATAARRVAEADAAGFIQALRQRANRTGRQLFVSPNGYGALLAEPSQRVEEVSGAQIASICGSVGEQTGTVVLVEERPVRGRLPEFVCPTGCLRLITARPANHQSTVVFAGQAFAYDTAAQQAEQPLSLEGAPVAARQGAAMTAHLRLYAHPFLADGTLQARDGSQVLLASLVSLVTPDVPQAEAAQQPVRSRIETALAALELLPQITAVVQRSMPDRLGEIEQRVGQADRELRQAQQRVIDLLAQQRELRAERQLIEREQQALGSETVMKALREAGRIAALPTVREIGIVERDRSPNLRVRLHPVVVEHQGERYLCREMSFTLPLANPSYSTIRWEPTSTSSPHPHISQGGESCWGQAQAELNQALRAGELARAVVLISGWAALYNHASPYTSLANFPTTALVPGFHPEEN